MHWSGAKRRLQSPMSVFYFSRANKGTVDHLYIRRGQVGFAHGPGAAICIDARPSRVQLRGVVFICSKFGGRSPPRLDGGQLPSHQCRHLHTTLRPTSPGRGIVSSPQMAAHADPSFSATTPTGWRRPGGLLVSVTDSLTGWSLNGLPTLIWHAADGAAEAKDVGSKFSTFAEAG